MMEAAAVFVRQPACKSVEAVKRAGNWQQAGMSYCTSADCGVQQHHACTTGN